MKYFLLLFLFFTQTSHAQITLLSWNIENIGRSKSDAEIDSIANTVKPYDIVTIQEVVAHDPGGAQAIARLAAALNNKGAKWDYAISDITSGTSYKSERYAFLWKTSKVKLVGKPFLEKQYSLEIDREPFLATFESAGKQFTVVSFHAITKSKQPETEIKYFKFLPAEYPDKNLLFAGDFNCPQSHTVFNPLRKMGYLPILQGQKTSLRQQCFNGDCLASEFDNIWYDTAKITSVQSGVVHFYQSFTDIKEARQISDHIPVWCRFWVK